MTTIDTTETADFTHQGQAVPLSSLSLGTSCRVMAVDETRESLLRLMEMGLIPGATLTLERSAPLKSPVSVRLPGCTLAVRRDDARRILVLPLEKTGSERE
jgi:Fe2+ transport system protein FeoA